MITLAHGKEITIAGDTISDISSNRELDGAGGSRETLNERTDNKTVIISDSAGQRPLILKETEPKIEGVIIVAEGGDNVYLKDAFIKAAQSVLGVEPHKIQVFKMRK